jgi:hypothetical protein
MLSTAKGECLSVAEVHATAEHLLSVLYDSDHYMDFEGTILLSRYAANPSCYPLNDHHISPLAYAF